MCIRDRAITVLGRRQLQRWLQLLLFSMGDSHGTSSPLLHLAATRGRLLELLAAELHPGNSSFADQAFMVGILSLMPALVGLPIEEIVAPLGVDAEVRNALCDESGELGNMLRLTEASEVGDPQELITCLGAIPALSIKTLNHCITQALSLSLIHISTSNALACSPRGSSSTAASR